MLPKLLEIGKFPPRVKGGAAPSPGDRVEGRGHRSLEAPDHHVLARGWRPVHHAADGDLEGSGSAAFATSGCTACSRSGRDTLAMHWQRHKVGAAHWREMAERGEKMPVCIAIGADPASVYSASAPLPPTIDEFLFAGFLRKAPVRLVKALTCDLEVPADAEFVIEGYIDPAESLVTEGPFGDHTGFYSLADLYPLVHVTAITMREHPVYATTIVGRPPMEDFYLGHATERIFLPLLKLTVPEIVDYHMPAEGIFHNLVFVSIDKQYPGQAYKVMNAMWGQGLMSLAKVLVVVDKLGERARSARGVVGGAQQHRSRARRAFHHGTDGCARSLEPGVHVRLEDGNRRDEEVAGGGVLAGVADADRDGCGDEGEGGRDVGAAGAGPAASGSALHRGHPCGAEAMSAPVAPSAREGQTFGGTSRLIRYANFVKLPHTLFALPFALVGVTIASYVKDVRLARRLLGRDRVHRRPLRRDGVQPHRRPPH